MNMQRTQPVHVGTKYATRVGAAVSNHRHAAPARNVAQPEPGFFKMRLVKGGPQVACRIAHEPATDPLTGEVLDRSPLWTATIDGEVKADAGPEPSQDVFRIWHYGEPIDRDEYDYMLADADWCRKYQPTAPQANPRRPVEKTQAPLV